MPGDGHKWRIMPLPELGDSDDFPLTPKEQRRREINPNTTTGTWHIVKELAKPKSERKYGRRAEDIPFWWIVLDKWGINSFLYAILTAAAVYISHRLNGGK